MNFDLSADQAAIQQMVRDFTEKEVLPGVLDRDASGTFPVDQYAKMGEMGLIGLPYPKEYGGQD